jgi:hypothetical protein
MGDWQSIGRLSIKKVPSQDYSSHDEAKETSVGAHTSTTHTTRPVVPTANMLMTASTAGRVSGSTHYRSGWKKTVLIAMGTMVTLLE